MLRTGVLKFRLYSVGVSISLAWLMGDFAICRIVGIAMASRASRIPAMIPKNGLVVVVGSGAII